MTNKSTSKLPTKNGFETFSVFPVKIVNGVVSNRKEPDRYAKEKRKQTI